MRYKLDKLSTEIKEESYLPDMGRRINIERGSLMESSVKIVKSWLYKGRKCVVLSRDISFEVYIETKNRIEFDHGNENISPKACVDAYSDITFAGKLDITPYEEDIWYFGMKLPKNKVWSHEEIRIEAEKMAESIFRYEEAFNMLNRTLDYYTSSINSVKDNFRLK